MENRIDHFVQGEFDKTLANFNAMAADPGLRAQIAQAVALCTGALRAGRKILFAGNGGSAADAQHWAGELVSRFYYDRPGLPAIALTTDTSILTAIGNDYGYDYTFARQIEALGQEGDVFVAISTSGTIICGLGFLAALYFYNFVSLASLVMVALMPVILLFQGMFGAIPLALVLMALIFWKHSENIQRLMAGEEHPWKKK